MPEYAHLYRELTEKLHAVRRKELSLSLSSGLMMAAAAALLLGLAFSIYEALAFSSVATRTALVLVWGVAMIGAAAYFTRPSMMRLLGIQPKASEDEIARRVGTHFPTMQDKFLNALQLYRSTESNAVRGASPELALASFGTIGTQARSLNFEAILEKDSSKRALMLFAGVGLLTLAAFGVFNKAMPSALYRLLHFNRSFVPPAPFALVVEPSDAKALRGENVEIRVRVTGDASKVSEITLCLRERTITDDGATKGQENFDATTLRPDSTGIYRYQVTAIKRGVEFYAEVPWYLDFVRSEIGRIAVTDRPDIRSLAGMVFPPAYTKTPPRPLDESSAAIMSLTGTRVELAATSNKPLKAAEIVLLKQRRVGNAGNAGNVEPSRDSIAARFDTARVPLNVRDRQAFGAFTANFNGEYFISITDQNGERNAEPVRYSVLALQDAAPTIALLQPTGNVELSESGIVPMKFTISDDYGFSAIKLHYRLVESRYAKPQEKFSVQAIPLPAGSDKTAEMPYVWDVNKVGLSPADRYEFYVEVFDNDIITGPKSARTGVTSVRLPSLDEIFKEADKTQELATKDLQNILKEAEQMQKDMQEVSRELRKQQEKPQADWKEKKRLEEMLKKQEEFSKRVEQTRQALEEMTNKLQQNQTISQETLQQYMELQKLMKQVDSPELRKAAQQLQKAMEQMSPQQMQQALEKFQMNEEDFKRSIERTMKILQRLQAQQKTDELAKRAQELKEQQQDLQKQMQNMNMQDAEKREQLARQQEEARKDMQNLSKELNDLEKLMKDIEQKGGKDMPMEELKKAQEALKKEQTEQAMQQAQQQMQQGEQQQAQQQMQQAQQNLQEFAQQMQNLKKEMQRNVQKEALRSMQKAMQNMLSLSKRQEQLKKQSQSMDANSTQFREQAQQQSGISQDMRNIVSQMMDLAQKSFSVTQEMAKSLGDAMQQMEIATDNLEDRNAQQAQQNQQNAMSSMNKAATQMQSAMSNMQGGAPGGSGQPNGEGEGQGAGGGGSFMERMQQMAAQQQAVNQQMQQMLQQGQGQGQDGKEGRLEQSMSEQAGRAAAQQDAIRKSLEEINKQQKQGGKRAMGDLDRLAKEMQEIVSDMKNGTISEETLRRQERILSRLLDATRSTRERDYEKQRDARSGENVVRSSPAEIDMKTQEGRTRALQELMKSVQQGYTKDYETLIRRYFEALQSSPPQRTTTPQ
jgi:hypothetical protein